MKNCSGWGRGERRWTRGPSWANSGGSAPRRSRWGECGYHVDFRVLDADGKHLAAGTAYGAARTDDPEKIEIVDMSVVLDLDDAEKLLDLAGN